MNALNKIFLSIVSIYLLASCSKQSAQQKKIEPGKTPVDTSVISLGDEWLRFLVVGDWGRNGDFNQQDVANQMNDYARIAEPEFIISTGDNFYSDGVASINDPLWMSSFENVYKGGALLIKWFPVLGNHDYRGNPQAQIDYTNKSRRWNLPARYYTFSEEIDDSISARFIFIDTSPFINKYHKESEKYADLSIQDTTAQLRWLDSVLTTSKETWKIVVGHHPVYSSSPKHGDTKEMIDIIKPRLDKHNVHIYFCGHDHDLQHQKPEGSFVDYIVSGAGSEVRTTQSNEITKFSEAVPGFILASISSDSLRCDFINHEGRVIYKYTRGK